MSKNDELVTVGQHAALTAELAAENIRRYLTLHGEGGVAVVVKPVNLVMKIADDAESDTKAAIDAVAKAAINNLQRYLDSQRGG